MTVLHIYQSFSYNIDSAIKKNGNSKIIPILFKKEESDIKFCRGYNRLTVPEQYYLI